VALQSKSYDEFQDFIMVKKSEDALCFPELHSILKMPKHQSEDNNMVTRKSFYKTDEIDQMSAQIYTHLNCIRQHTIQNHMLQQQIIMWNVAAQIWC
jgi:hypothetical protein